MFSIDFYFRSCPKGTIIFIVSPRLLSVVFKSIAPVVQHKLLDEVISVSYFAICIIGNPKGHANATYVTNVKGNL